MDIIPYASVFIGLAVIVLVCLDMSENRWIKHNIKKLSAIHRAQETEIAELSQEVEELAEQAEHQSRLLLLVLNFLKVEHRVIPQHDELVTIEPLKKR